MGGSDAVYLRAVPDLVAVHQHDPQHQLVRQTVVPRGPRSLDRLLPVRSRGMHRARDLQVPVPQGKVGRTRISLSPPYQSLAEQ